MPPQRHDVLGIGREVLQVNYFVSIRRIVLCCRGLDVGVLLGKLEEVFVVVHGHLEGAAKAVFEGIGAQDLACLWRRLPGVSSLVARHGQAQRLLQGVLNPARPAEPLSSLIDPIWGSSPEQRPAQVRDEMVAVVLEQVVHGSLPLRVCGQPSDDALYLLWAGPHTAHDHAVKELVLRIVLWLAVVGAARTGLAVATIGPFVVKHDQAAVVGACAK
mmetsp:Transcript_27962/g.39283  ORF Transcript_27962/g.39283 Transcript_27962/m.39283 type:complete len:216 (-) Transcript_27962:86-733(-)